jgi:glycosyltransferase involved in cell wall biosynthesis
MWNRNKDQVVDSEREKAYYNSMDKIVFVSNDAQNQFNKLYHNKIKSDQDVIYNFIPVNEILEMSKEFTIEKNSKFTICAVGRFYSEKAYDRLIRVAALLKQNQYDFEIWIVAEGLLYKEMKELTYRLQVNDKIIFWGFQENPYPYIKNADIFISTSKTEAMPLVVCEALCLAKPVITTKTTGPIELLSGGHGILTDHDDKSIYDAIEKFIINPDLILQYQKKAIERARIFTAESSIKLIHEIL